MIVLTRAETFGRQRKGKITDAFGRRWGQSRHVLDISVAELSQDAAEIFGLSGPGLRAG